MFDTLAPGMSEAMRTGCSSPLVAALAEAVLEAHAKRTRFHVPDHGKFVDVEGSESTEVGIERVSIDCGRRRDRPALSLLDGGRDQDRLQ